MSDGILERIEDKVDEVLTKLGGTVTPPPPVDPPPPPTGPGLNTIIDVVQSGGDETQVPFSVPAQGSYFFWVRGLWPDFSKDSFFISVDGGVEDIFDAAEGAWLPSWQWRRMVGRGGTGTPGAVNPRLFTLAAGNHTLRVRVRETGAQFNGIIVTNDLTFLPPGTTLPVPPPPPPPPPPDPNPVPVPGPIDPPVDSGGVPTTGLFVAPDWNGSGTATDPMSLQKAFATPGTIPPGTTVWLRGGLYNYRADVTLRGTQAAPIKITSYPGEWARICGRLWVKSSDVWFMNFEQLGRDPNRRSTYVRPSDGFFAYTWTPPDLLDGGIDAIEQDRDTVTGITGRGFCKFINLVIHDANNSGLNVWATAPGNEVYGCLIYNNGWFGLDRAHGHGIYTQNLNGQPNKLIQENIIFNNFVYGMQAYGSSDMTNNYDITGDIWGPSGAPAKSNQQGLVLGSGGPADNLNLNDCFGHRTSYWEVGYYYGSTENNNLVMNRCIIPGGINFHRWKKITGAGNRVYGVVGEQTTVGAPAKLDRSINTFLPELPKTGVEVFVRPNKYARRGNVVVYNWAKGPTVQADLSAVLKNGDAFELRDAMNFLGTPILKGTYNGPVTIPMTGLTVAAPIGFPAPAHTAPEWGAFVVLGK